MQLESMVLVGIGGFVGANARYLLALLVNALVGTRFPWSTLLINVSGSLLLGFFVARFSRDLPEGTRLLVATGFFGAYTTFSTYSVESASLLREATATALVYIVATNALCLGAALIGTRL